MSDSEEFSEKRHRYETQDFGTLELARKADAQGRPKIEFYVNREAGTARLGKFTAFFYETSDGFSLNSYDWWGRELLTEEDFRLIDDACWSIAKALGLLPETQPASA